MDGTGAVTPSFTVILIEQGEKIEQLLTRLLAAFQQVVRLIDMEGLDYETYRSVK